jgi:hypothetical protein
MAAGIKVGFIETHARVQVACVQSQTPKEFLLESGTARRLAYKVYFDL